MGDKFYTNINGRPTLQEITSGDVSGPSSAVDNAICRFDGTTGKVIQSSLCSIDDTGKIVIGSNTFSGSFPCQLEVISTSNNIAKFGSNYPIYVRDSHPRIGFNLYYDGSNWLFAHEINKSTPCFAGSLAFNISDGSFMFHLSSTSGISGASVTLYNLFNLNYSGVYSFGHGTQNILVFPAVGYAVPSLTTRSVGTKIVLYPGVSASNVDYAIGIESYCLWNSVPLYSNYYKWYFGTTPYYLFKATEAFLPQCLELASQSYSGNRDCWIDFHSDDTYTDYGLRILKGAGANGLTYIQHRGTGNLILNAYDAGGLEFKTRNTQRMVIDANGTFYMGWTTTTTAYSTVVKNTAAGNVMTYTSSKRWKTDIKDLDFDTSLIYKLRPVNFYPLQGYGEHKEIEIGLIAEEAEEVNKKFVTYGADGLTDGISWFRLITVMLAEMQKINKRLEVIEGGNKKRNRNR